MWLGGSEPVGTLLSVYSWDNLLKLSNQIGPQALVPGRPLYWKSCLCSCLEGTLHQMNAGSECSEDRVFQYLYCQWLGFLGSHTEALSLVLTLDLKGQGESVIQGQEADVDPGVPQDALI